LELRKVHLAGNFSDSRREGYIGIDFLIKTINITLAFIQEFPNNEIKKPNAVQSFYTTNWWSHCLSNGCFPLLSYIYPR